MIYTQNVTGLQHSGYEQVKEQLELGTELHLERNPDNKFDPLAIKVLLLTAPEGSAGPLEPTHIGWIPMKSGKERNLAQKIIADGLDNGLEYKVTVAMHELSQPIFNRLSIAIQEVKESD